MSSTHRLAVLALTVVLATTLAGCGLGGSNEPTGPSTITGLSVDCSSVENVQNPPVLERLQIRQTGGAVLFDLDRPMPNGHALYVKADGDPVEHYNPRKAGAGPTAHVDKDSTVVMVEKKADGSCARWEGPAVQMMP